MPKYKLRAINGPKVKKIIAAGTINTPTTLIAFVNSFLTSVNFLSITKFDSFGSRAVITETVIMECGKIKIKYALL